MIMEEGSRHKIFLIWQILRNRPFQFSMKIRLYLSADVKLCFCLMVTDFSCVSINDGILETERRVA